MLEKLKGLITDSRKGALFTAAWLIKVLTFLGSFLAFWLKWNAQQTADWSSLVAVVQSLLDQLGTVTTQLAGIWAAFIAIEDAFHKLQLPWFTDDKGKTVTANPRSTTS